jgi:predicted membrane chloride channel (bestrophin family)
MAEVPGASDDRNDNLETTSLTLKQNAHFATYGTRAESHDYSIDDIITLKVFLVHRGTVFYSKTLWIETLCMAALYWTTFAVLYWHRWENFADFVGKEVNLRAFIAMFSTLIGLLLSFYTALNLGRWWAMRMMVQDVQEGCKKLIVMLAHGVTRDEKVLEAVPRYARASLFLIFAVNHEDHSRNPLVAAEKAGYLTAEESGLLRQLSASSTYVQAEALWAWLANIVTRLHDQGLTKGPPHYCALMAAVEQGRGGVAGVQAYLETPIPMGYVHLLCWMVKLHNIILTMMMALTSVKLAGGRKGFDEVGVFRTAFRAFFMPFLYNAILILNAEVTDPFGNDVQDFDQQHYDRGLKDCAGSLIKASQNLPPWLTQKNKKFAAFGEDVSAKPAALSQP